MQSTIESVSVTPIRLPLPNPHRTASGTITESPLVLTEIRTSEGVIGKSIIFTYSAAALEPTSSLVKNIFELIEGKGLSPSSIEKELLKKFRLLGSQGLVGMALAAIDMALWDAMLKSREVNLIESFGGTPQQIPVYGAIGFDGEKESARIAESLVNDGLLGVKAKIGYPDFKEELKVISAIRSAVGPNIDIMLDYNQCLTPIEAIERIKRIQDSGHRITWFEESTLAHDYSGHAEIRKSVETPIQAGENWWNTLDLRHALDAKATDYVMLDVMKVGGVSGWLRANALCEIQQVRISSHLWPEISAQLLSVSGTPHWIEYCDWWNPLLKQPLEIVDGFGKINGQPGTGTDWNQEIAEKYRV